ncbi:MAG TPA: selenocysteine-specific translation elongation factor, partial [Chloroflexota bacterium]|nr:selenocysteine-specific translation elongation factor [Chloroflexota bacterium]
MKVIGTAGHIDHGKSTLVERLTGIDPDRLEEEKRRGMTIDLGFAWLTLPRSGPVSIVDVPGHERFVKNMLAGVGGIDAALLVVAADEGVMPQTREHIDILSLLDIRAGVIAITKCDLVDAEWLELVRLDVTDAVAGTSIADLPIVPVSARTGEGLPELVEALDAAAAQAEDRVDGARGYVPVDRVFSAAGFGTVVTGTLHDGSIGVGETWELMPGHRLVRIRSLQVHRQPAQTAGPGARVAVNLAGIDYQEVKRGDVLAYPGSVGETKRFDARLTVLPSAPFSLAQGLPVSLHVGAAERQATLALLDRDELAPGTAGWVQLRTTDELPVVAGQRFIVRLPSPARTVG